MTTDVRCLVETESPYPVLRVVGDLDATTGASVRSAILELLLDHPVGLVVDVSEVRVVDPSAVTVLTDSTAQAADWADARVL
ncbi:MAG TPA: STAS domain-containing protein, partial [Catenuloplanes sp.]